MPKNRRLIPTDEQGNVVQLSPDVPTLAQTYDTSLDTVSTVTFHQNTSWIRVVAIDQDIWMKWGTTPVTNANFSEILLAGQYLDFYVPIETSTGLDYTAVNFLEKTASAELVVIEK